MGMTFSDLFEIDSRVSERSVEILLDTQGVGIDKRALPSYALRPEETTRATGTTG